MVSAIACCKMPAKRYGLPGKTVDVYDATYDTLRKEAERRRLTVKAFINKILQTSESKFKYLAEVAPHLSVDDFGENYVTIKDSKNKKLVDVYRHGSELRCSEHKNEDDCIHIRFLWISPDVGQLPGVDPGKKKAS